MGFTADFVHVAVFKRHQVRDQACSGAIREGFKKSVDQVQTVMYPKPGVLKVNHPQSATDTFHLLFTC